MLHAAGVYFNDDQRLQTATFDKAAGTVSVEWEEQLPDGSRILNGT
jgi:hypothetical protein